MEAKNSQYELQSKTPLKLKTLIKFGYKDTSCEGLHHWQLCSCFTVDFLLEVPFCPLMCRDLELESKNLLLCKTDSTFMSRIITGGEFGLHSAQARRRRPRLGVAPVNCKATVSTQTASHSLPENGNQVAWLVFWHSGADSAGITNVQVQVVWTALPVRDVKIAGALEVTLK